MIILLTVLSVLSILFFTLVIYAVIRKQNRDNKPSSYTIAYWVGGHLHLFSFDSTGKSNFMFTGKKAKPPLVWKKLITQDEFIAVHKNGQGLVYRGRRTPLEMIRDHLEERGFDGLTNTDCGCSLDDLCPCGETPLTCGAAYKHIFDGVSYMHLSKHPEIARKDFDNAR